MLADRSVRWTLVVIFVVLIAWSIAAYNLDKSAWLIGVLGEERADSFMMSLYEDIVFFATVTAATTLLSFAITKYQRDHESFEDRVKHLANATFVRENPALIPLIAKELQRVGAITSHCVCDIVVEDAHPPWNAYSITTTYQFTMKNLFRYEPNESHSGRASAIGDPVPATNGVIGRVSKLAVMRGNQFVDIGIANPQLTIDRPKFEQKFDVEIGPDGEASYMFVFTSYAVKGIPNQSTMERFTREFSVSITNRTQQPIEIVRPRRATNKSSLKATLEPQQSCVETFKSVHASEVVEFDWL